MGDERTTETSGREPDDRPAADARGEGDVPERTDWANDVTGGDGYPGTTDAVDTPDGRREG